jgi:hypothetical protein
MDMNGLRVTKGPGGKEIKLKKESDYYSKIARQLIPFTTIDNVDGVNVHLCERLIRVLEGLKIPETVIPIMERKGLLKINEQDPESYYIFPEGLAEEEIPAVPTRSLQKMAKRLFKQAMADDPENTNLRYMSLYLIQIRLNTWCHDADHYVNQMIDAGYLVEKKNGIHKNDAKQKFYFIFPTQKQSQEFQKKEKAA